MIYNFLYVFHLKEKCLNYEVYDKWNMTFKEIEINYEKLLETWNHEMGIQWYTQICMYEGKLR